VYVSLTSSDTCVSSHLSIITECLRVIAFLSSRVLRPSDASTAIRKSMGCDVVLPGRGCSVFFSPKWNEVQRVCCIADGASYPNACVKASTPTYEGGLFTKISPSRCRATKSTSSGWRKRTALVPFRGSFGHPSLETSGACCVNVHTLALPHTQSSPPSSWHACSLTRTSSRGTKEETHSVNFKPCFLFSHPRGRYRHASDGITLGQPRLFTRAVKFQCVVPRPFVSSRLRCVAPASRLGRREIVFTLNVATTAPFSFGNGDEDQERTRNAGAWRRVTRDGHFSLPTCYAQRQCLRGRFGYPACHRLPSAQHHLVGRASAATPKIAASLLASSFWH